MAIAQMFGGRSFLTNPIGAITGIDPVGDALFGPQEAAEEREKERERLAQDKKKADRAAVKPKGGRRAILQAGFNPGTF